MRSPAAYALAFVSLHTGAAYAQAARRDDKAGADWLTYNRTYEGDRYSPLAQLTTANVARLRPVCSYDTKENVSFQTGPLVVDGVMYFTTDTTTYAIDAGSCALRWKARTSQPATYLKANRGVAYANQNDFPNAEHAYLEAIKSDPKSAEAQYNLGLSFDKMGKHDEASAAFKQAVALAPVNPAIKDSPTLKKHLGA